MAAMSAGLSTTHNKELSLDGSRHMRQVLLSLKQKQVLQTVTCFLRSLMPAAKALTSVSGAVSRYITKRSADFSPIPGSLQNCLMRRYMASG
jgi:hypothetical protein